VVVQSDGAAGTGWDAGAAAIATAGIDEGWFAPVYLQDRLAAAYIARLALATGAAKFIHDVGYGRHLCFGRFDHCHQGSLSAIQNRLGMFDLYTPRGYMFLL
jgi:hypothetical protein